MLYMLQVRNKTIFHPLPAFDFDLNESEMITRMFLYKWHFSFYNFFFKSKLEHYIINQY